MGFDICALDADGMELTYFRTHAGGFRWLADEGYDWFALINAEDCDGGCSGTGNECDVQLDDLQHAMQVMDGNETIGPAKREIAETTDDYSEDDVIYIALELYHFMQTCISECVASGKPSIKICFS